MNILLPLITTITSILFAQTLPAKPINLKKQSNPLSLSTKVVQKIKSDFTSEIDVHSNLNKPGFIISIASSDSHLLQIASGAADIEQAKLIDGNTVFHIASLSKQITAAALAHAITDGKMSLNDSVAKWIPQAKQYGSGLKVKHLLYMTSGLTEYMALPRTDNNPWNTFHYFSIEDAIEHSLSVDELLFKPGSQWAYSNINYMLIAKMVSLAYEMPFSEVVTIKLFAPLNMNSSLINDDITQLIPNRANAYMPRSKAVVKDLNDNAHVYASTKGKLIMIRRNSPHYGGSGVMTSMNDWVKWQNEVIHNKVFGTKFWELMTSTMKFQHTKENDAFGLVHSTYQEQPTLWYAGGDIDTSSYAITFPQLHLSINCFSNNPLDSCRTKTYALLDILYKNSWGKGKGKTRNKSKR